MAVHKPTKFALTSVRRRGVGGIFSDGRQKQTKEENETEHLGQLQTSRFIR